MARLTPLLTPRAQADTSFGQAIRKKGSESAEDSYFAGSSSSRKGKKQQGKKKGVPLDLSASEDAPAAETRNDLKVPVGHLSALLSLSIPPPTSSADVPRVVENLKLKKRYFVENQEQKTRERIEEVERKLGKVSVKDEGEEAKKEEATTA